MARTKKIAKPERPDPPPERVVIPERLREARKAAGFTQPDLGLAAGVSIRTISRLETGAARGSPSLADVGHLADVLGVGLDWLAPKPK